MQRILIFAHANDYFSLAFLGKDKQSLLDFTPIGGFIIAWVAGWPRSKNISWRGGVSEICEIRIVKCEMHSCVKMILKLVPRAVSDNQKAFRDFKSQKLMGQKHTQ